MSEPAVARSASLREQQAELTRELIMRALVERLERGELAEISVPDIAAAAGVSVRTVYRYYPTREQLLQAGAEWVGDRVIGRPLPETVDDLLDVAQTARHFDEHPQLVRALVATGAGRQLRSVRRARRREAVANVVRAVSRNLPPSEQRRAAAVIGCLDTLGTWQALRDEYGLDAEESGLALEWALRTLLDDVRRRNDEARRQRREEAGDDGRRRRSGE